ncbi:sulfite exporter TauE/SafE family protein [Candidatus Riflebacteria bacterium]
MITGKASLWLALSLGALVTSTISALIGAAGGILLLSIMLIFLPLAIVVPIHGLVQLASNVTRSFFFREFIKSTICFYYAAGVFPGAYLGYRTLKIISGNLLFEAIVKLVLSLYLFYSLWPKKTDTKGGAIILEKGFVFVGAMTGFLGMLVGATGPFIATFFLRPDLKKNEIIATKAACQMVTHLSKIPVFIALNFDFQLYSKLIGVMVLFVFLGTYSGKRLGKYISEEKFRFIFKCLIFIASCRLFYDGFHSVFLV